MTTTAEYRVAIIFEGKTEQFKRALKGVRSSLSTFSQTVARMSKIAGGVALAGLTAAIGGAVASIKAAGDAFEDLSKFQAVFRKESAAVRAELERFARATGRSRYDLLKMAAAAQDTFVPLGFARKEAAKLSSQLVKLAVDVGSFNNEAAPDVLNAFMSAIVGNHEAVRRYGIVITQTALKQELLNMGIKGGVQQATEQQKALARLRIILRSTADAQGDAVRTAGSFANQWRRIRSILKDAAIDIGLKLLPVVTPLLQRFGDFAAVVAPKVVEQVARLAEKLRDLADRSIFRVIARVEEQAKILRQSGKEVNYLAVTLDVLKQKFIEVLPPVVKETLVTFRDCSM